MPAFYRNLTLLESSGKSQLPQLGLHWVRKLFQGSLIQSYVRLRLVACPRIIHLFEMTEISAGRQNHFVKWWTVFRELPQRWHLKDSSLTLVLHPLFYLWIVLLLLLVDTWWPAYYQKVNKHYKSLKNLIIFSVLTPHMRSRLPYANYLCIRLFVLYPRQPSWLYFCQRRIC